MVIGMRGKRLRPALLLLSCASFGPICERAISYAALTEMIHTASLAHDDVIDEADSRRGAPSAPAFWGNKLSVLVGDYLLARVFELATHDGDLHALHLLSAAATEMGRAVVLECTAMDIEATEETYFSVIRGKTAALFSATLAVGAHLGGASLAQEDALAGLGESFGCAFQLADDLLDLQGSAAETGKPHGADWILRHATLPLLYTLRTAPPSVSDEVRALWRHDTLTPENQREMTRLVSAAGGFDYGWKKVKEYQEHACASLEAIPCGPARDALWHLCTDAFPLPVLPPSSAWRPFELTEKGIP